MPRAPNEKAETAKQMYLEGQKMVDIAKALGVPDGTVRRWKKTYQWDCERADKKANVRNNLKLKKEAVAADVIQVCENSELNDRQRLFCLHYVRCFNATKAYQKAYGCSYETAMTNGASLLRNTQIRDEINHLKQNRLNRELLSEDDLFQKYMDIAFSDMTDYASFGPGGVVLKDSGQVDGTLITEVKEGKSGVSVKLADRMQALKWLTDRYTSFNPEQQARIDKYKAETAKVEAENKERAGTEQPGDDGFLEALNGSAAEDWADED